MLIKTAIAATQMISDLLITGLLATQAKHACRSHELMPLFSVADVHTHFNIARVVMIFASTQLRVAV